MTNDTYKIEFLLTTGKPMTIVTNLQTQEKIADDFLNSKNNEADKAVLYSIPFHSTEIIICVDYSHVEFIQIVKIVTP